MLPQSRANGPGIRFTIWTQGCSLGCRGCFNPGTHPGSSGTTWPVADLVDKVLSEGADIEGVTLTGGEPLEQPAAVAALCSAVRAGGELGIVVLTGYTEREIRADAVLSDAVANADMVIAGRYNARLRVATGLRGSSNKTYWARTGRYREEDFAAVPDLEFVTAPAGELTITGMRALDGDLPTGLGVRGWT